MVKSLTYFLHQNIMFLLLSQ
jgi:hypothetical protein